MTKVFADTVYWVATVCPKDQWKEAAIRAKEKLGNVRIFTTDEVLAEFLNLLSPYGPRLRKLATDSVRTILRDTNVKVVAQTRDSFLQGVRRYGDRLDKNYSLTDCISMNTIKSESISEVLTKDLHFAQEGFTVLMV